VLEFFINKERAELLK